MPELPDWGPANFVRDFAVVLWGTLGLLGPDPGRIEGDKLIRTDPATGEDRPEGLPFGFPAEWVIPVAIGATAIGGVLLYGAARRAQG